jgi:putative membrane protein
MGMLLILVIVIGAAALAYNWYRRRGGRGFLPGGQDDPLEIARRRYARGEITRAEFEQIKRDLYNERGM